MDPHNSQMVQQLALLGEAHREGAFSDDAVQYPWQTAKPEVSRLTHRRFAWARVAVPLAAAATVAVLFVGPRLWEPQVVHEMAENALDTGVFEKPEQPLTAESVPTTVEAVSCDYNGDGLVDGKDIQAFVSSLEEAGGDPSTAAKYLQRCLLDD